MRLLVAQRFALCIGEALDGLPPTWVARNLSTLAEEPLHRLPVFALDRMVAGGQDVALHEVVDVGELRVVAQAP